MRHSFLSAVKYPMAISIFLLSMTSFAKPPAGQKNPKDILAVYLNGRQLNLSKDSLVITATGPMQLVPLSIGLSAAPKIKFKIVIRHASPAAFGFLAFDERYNDGQEFESIDIENILRKTKVGDQILIIPSDNEAKFENTKEPIVVHVIGDQC